MMTDDPKKNIDIGNETTNSRIQLEIRDKGRLENFVDAVFAIAMTLLVLDLSVPIVTDSNASVLSFLGTLCPSLLVIFYLFSF